MGEGAIIAINLVMGLIDRAASITNLIKTAKAEGRDVTVAELDSLANADDLARQQLVEAIAARKNLG